ncbi:UNVERIFIED_CONTAM: hypothetical protein HDU68_002193, partial [Siphonaria sp. JEL0065]
MNHPTSVYPAPQPAPRPMSQLTKSTGISMSAAAAKPVPKPIMLHYKKAKKKYYAQDSRKYFYVKDEEGDRLYMTPEGCEAYIATYRSYIQIAAGHRLVIGTDGSWYYAFQQIQRQPQSQQQAQQKQQTQQIQQMQHTQQTPQMHQCQNQVDVPDYLPALQTPLNHQVPSNNAGPTYVRSPLQPRPNKVHINVAKFGQSKASFRTSGNDNGRNSLAKDNPNAVDG